MTQAHEEVEFDGRKYRRSLVDGHWTRDGQWVDEEVERCLDEIVRLHAALRAKRAGGV